MSTSTNAINHPSLEQAWRTLESCHASVKKRGRPETLCIPGVSGVGKTTLLKRYCERFPKIISEGQTIIPVVYIAIPARPTIKQFTIALLQALDAPLAQIGTATDQLQRFKFLARACKVELLLVDEMQHFVDRGSIKTYGAVADEVKVLFDELKIAMVLAGAPRMSILFEANMQLRRRFKSCIFLRPFDKQYEFEFFRSFLHTLVTDLMLPNAERLVEPTTAERIWYATDGVPGNIVDLIDRFDQLLHAMPANSWTRHTLAEAFRLSIWRDVPDTLNPFLAGMTNLRRLDQRGEPFAPSILDGDNHAFPVSHESIQMQEAA